VSQDRGMFRIYHCSRCNNIGYSQVESEDDASKCSLCQALILHEKGTVYAVTRQEAQAFVRDLALESNRSRTVSKGSVSRGLGVKKRVYNIIEALVDLRRGKPVSIEEVMRECSEANIDLGRAMNFLDTLESEGLIISDGVQVMITKGAWLDV
jgi:hypothetical protein